MPRQPVEPKAQGIKLLSRREHSAKELTRKLVQRGVSSEEASLAVEELGRDGWQSDERYAELLVRSRVAQGHGPLRIKSELRQAGVADETARNALDDSGADWETLCAEAHAKRFGATPKTSSERAKQYRFLAGRGFESGQISRAMKGELEESY